MLSKKEKLFTAGNEREVINRLCNEKDQLYEMWRKLGDFMRSDNFKKLPERERMLFFRQDYIMEQYIDILQERYYEILKRVHGGEYGKQ